ncbi:hypothetical protein HQ535_07085 [bacterium]|nr:hypothetical protein [bacterium]
MDPLGHPDLIAVGRRLRQRMDETLEAEQHAARAAAMRRRTIRDLLLEAADREASASVLAGTEWCAGSVEVVGADHAILTAGGRSRVVALAHLAVIELRQ